MAAATSVRDSPGRKLQSLRVGLVPRILHSRKGLKRFVAKLAVDLLNLAEVMGLSASRTRSLARIISAIRRIPSYAASDAMLGSSDFPYFVLYAATNALLVAFSRCGE